MKIVVVVLVILGVAVLVGAFGLGGWLTVLVLSTAYGWAGYAFFHYRHVRQQELLHLLGAAAEAGSPVGAAVWAYLEDRPRGGLREFWVASLLFFMLPGYYWWHRRHSFDARLEQLALLLEEGRPLAQALRATPGVAARETVLAAAVGESTGNLALCLRQAPRWRLATVWLEELPRAFYPVFLFLVISAVFTFEMLVIAPRFEKMFADLHMKPPEFTRTVMDFGRGVPARKWILAQVPLVLVILTGFLFFNSSARWYCPGLGRLWRMHAQSRVLRMLGILLEAGQTLPRALAVLVDSDYFKGQALRRVHGVLRRIERGEALAPSLREEGLLPERMVALVGAAERAGNLPWALTVLGEHLAERTVRILRRITMVLFPLGVIAAGILVMFISLAWFVPLIQIMTELGR
jgi:type II secretory pathway component PulF